MGWISYITFVNMPPTIEAIPNAENNTPYIVAPAFEPNIRWVAGGIKARFPARQKKSMHVFAAKAN